MNFDGSFIFIVAPDKIQSIKLKFLSKVLKVKDLVSSKLGGFVKNGIVQE